MSKLKVCLCAPSHIQPSKKWIDSLPNCDIILTDDSNGQVKIDRDNVRIYDYKKQEEKLGKLYKDFEKFHKSSACKNFGHWLAYNEGYDIIIGIDSDCICPKDIVEKHIEALQGEGYGWENPLKNVGFYPRGFPYSQRDWEIVFNMGLWNNVLDINGADRQLTEPTEPKIKGTEVVGGIIPLSGMNWACKREFIPYLFFLPNFDYRGLKFRRHDDIFGGYIFQKFLKKLKKSISYGEPIVKHETEIIPEEDAKAEEAMNKYDDEFYEIIDLAFSEMSPKTDLLKRFNPKFEGTKFEALEDTIKLWKKMYGK